MTLNSRRPRFNPWVKKTPGEGNGYLHQYSCLENSMDREAWWAPVHGGQRAGHNWVTDTFSFTKRDTREIASKLCPPHEGTERIRCRQSRNKSSYWGPELTITLILELTSRTVRSKFPLVKPPNLWCFVMTTQAKTANIMLQ